MVAIKQLDRKGYEGTREFFAEVLLSSIVQQHLNIVELIGYYAEGNQRILVYEFMAKGSLEEHLFGTKFNCFNKLKQIYIWCLNRNYMY